MEMINVENPIDSKNTELLGEERNNRWKEKATMNHHFFIKRRFDLLLALGVCVIIIMGLICAIIFQNITHSNSHNNGPEKLELCLGKDCILSASLLLQNIDETIDPCDNFYKFACGGYIMKRKRSNSTENVPFAFSELSDIVSDQLNNILAEPINPKEQKPYKLAKRLYQSCKNLTSPEENQAEIKRILKSIGGWPLLGSNWTESSFSWTETIYKFRKHGFPTNQLFTLSLGIGSNNQSFVVQINQPSFPIPKVILAKGLKDPIVNNYYSGKLEMAKILAQNASYSSSNNFSLEFMDAFNFEIQLSTNQASNSFKTESEPNRTNIRFLNTFYPSIPWETYIKSIIYPNIKISLDTEINLPKNIPDYLSKLEMILRTTDKRTLSNYLMSIAAYSALYIVPNIGQKNSSVISPISPASSKSPKWKGCVDGISKFMPDSIGSLYIERFWKQSTSSKVSEIMENTKKGFLTNFNENDWIDELTRKQVRNKVSSLEAHIGYMEGFVNETRLNYYYDGELAFDQDASYLTNVLSFSKYKENQYWSEIGQHKIRSDNAVWAFFSPTKINAYQDLGTSTIYFPAGILQGYFFNPSRPSFMNYGTLGWIAGHETIHIFQDMENQSEQARPSSSIDERLARSRCFVEQFANYSFPGIQFLQGKIGKTKCGIKTSSENIADNGGIKAAYTAYQLWVRRNGMEKKLPGFPSYTQNQLFWLSAANVYCGNPSLDHTLNTLSTDTHAPMEYRVNGAFSNTEEFSKDFKCPSQSRMNPVSKCNLW